MVPLFSWLTQSSARVLVAALLVALGYFVADGYWKGRDLKRVCELLGSHEHIGEPVSAERQAIDAICLGQETEDE